MQVTLKIFRFNPEKDKRPSYKTYTLEAVETDRILDILEKVKGYQDGTLSFRRSCAHGICGSDSMRINGMNRLACKTLVHDVGTKITVEPILGLSVMKDLIVDMEPFFDNYKKVLPFFVNEGPLPADRKERLQSPEQRARFIAELEERMREAARKFEFEKAAQLRDRVKALKAREVGLAPAEAATEPEARALTQKYIDLIRSWQEHE